VAEQNRSQEDRPKKPWLEGPSLVAVHKRNTMKMSFLLLAVSLTIAINGAAQIIPSGSGAVPGSGNYAPGYTPNAPALVGIDNTPAAQAHVPESTTLVVGSIMLVPLAVSLVRVLRRRHELP
jgi:hypothetical protein